MKALNTIMKILAALAAIAGAVYVIATYGDKIVAWAKKLLGIDCCKCPCECDCDACDCECDCEDCECECDCEGCECVEEITEEVVEEAAEEAPAAEETAVTAEEGEFVKD